MTACFPVPAGSKPVWFPETVTGTHTAYLGFKREFYRQKLKDAVLESATLPPEGLQAVAGHLEEILPALVQEAVWEGSTRELVAQGLGLLELYPDEPMLWLAQGILSWNLGMYQDAEQQLRGAVDRFRGTSVRKLFYVEAARRLASLSRTLGGAHRNKEALWADLAVQWLGEASVDGSFTGRELRILAQMIYRGGGPVWPSLFLERMEALYTLMHSLGTESSFQVQFAGGLYWISLARDIYTDGLPKNENRSPSPLFTQRLDQATRMLEKALEIEPSFPEPCAELIRIQWLRKNSVRGQSWFEETVRRQVDYPLAYQYYLELLLATREANQEALIAFGRECLDTALFESGVPGIFYEVIDRISRGPSKSGLFQDPLVRDDLVMLWDGYCQVAQRSGRHREAQSYRILQAWILEEWDRARFLLEEIAGEVVEAVFPARFRPLRVTGEILARTGEHQETLHRALALVQSGASENALSLFREILDARPDFRVHGFIYSLVLDMAPELEGSDLSWMSVLPPSDFANWIPGAGVWEVQPGLGLSGTSVRHDADLTCRVTVEGNFEIRGEIYFESSDRTAWAELRLPFREDTGLRVSRSDDIISFGPWERSFAFHMKTTVAERNFFYLQVWNERFTLYWNNIPLWVDQPFDTRFAWWRRPLGRIGYRVGSDRAHRQQDEAGVRVRFANLQMHSLRVKPRTPRLLPRFAETAGRAVEQLRSTEVSPQVIDLEKMLRDDELMRSRRKLTGWAVVLGCIYLGYNAWRRRSSGK